MKFKDLLNEKFKNGFEFNGKYIEVFENPTSRELKSVTGQILPPYRGTSIRFGITDEKKPKIYAWNGEIIHHYMIKKIKFDFGFHWDGLNLVADGAEKEWTNYMDLKYRYEILKTIKKTIPKANSIFIRGLKLQRL